MSKYGENIYRRKDGRWEARYIFMRLPNGKAKYKSVYGKTHDIAKEKQLAGMLALAKEEASSCDLTVKELLVQYLAQTDVKTSTRERYWFMLERHIVPYFGKTSASKLTAKVLSAFLLHLKENGRLDGKGGLSAKTVRDLAVLLKTLLRFAQREYHCVCDALNAKLPSCKQKNIEVLSEQELAVMSKALSPSKKITCAVMLALHAGLRVGEVCALRVRDINFMTGTIQISRSVQRMTLNGKSQLLVQRPKSGQLRADCAASPGIITPVAEIYRRYAARRLYYDRSARPTYGSAHVSVPVYRAFETLRHPSPGVPCPSAYVRHTVYRERRGY